MLSAWFLGLWGIASYQSGSSPSHRVSTLIQVVMTRRSSEAQVASGSGTTRKRAASSSTATPTRQSKRVASGNQTPASSSGSARTSKYVERKPEKQSEEPETEIEQEDEGYEDEDGSVVSSPPASALSDEGGSLDGESEDDMTPRRRAAQKGKRAGGPAKAMAKDLWRPGVKTGLGPGKEVVIKMPKARQAGSTPYEAHTIHPNTFLFLRDLAENNEREWLKSRCCHLDRCEAEPAWQCTTRTFERRKRTLTPSSPP